MLRRLLILFFIVTNLTGQVSVAYVCGMMGKAPVVMKHCCCHPDEMAPACDKSSMGKGCCQTVVEHQDGSGDQDGLLHADTRLPDNLLSMPPALLPVMLALVLPSQASLVTWETRRDESLYGTDLYLRTQRLRL